MEGRTDRQKDGRKEGANLVAPEAVLFERGEVSKSYTLVICEAE